MWRSRLISLMGNSLQRGGIGQSSGWICVGCSRRLQSTASKSQPDPVSSNLTIGNSSFPIDAWTNAPPTILSQINRRLHTLQHHPISITRQLIESQFPTFKNYNELSPIVSVHQNFDSLLFPTDHPGRSKSDTYYINASTVLRTHTSAHQADVFRMNASDGFSISADVYRRDAVDRSHYPIFHQMEGARTWNSSGFVGNELEKEVWSDFEKLRNPGLKVEDSGHTFDPDNPLQKLHEDKVQAIEGASAHLKRSLELVVAEIFRHMRSSSALLQNGKEEEPLRVRWVPAYFPFTSPSWELEVFWNDSWLEVLGCGIIRQELLNNAGVPDRFGWAFGVGLDRMAMLLFQVPDIRLFWSLDTRFLGQFKEPNVTIFKPFSKHPACPKDVSFWIPQASNANDEFHENDLMELVREVCGDVVEDVALLDTFTHPKTGRTSNAYRINYRSLERTLTNSEVNELHEKLREAMVEKLKVELR